MVDVGKWVSREGAKRCSCEGRSLDARSASELARLGLDPCLRRGTFDKQPQRTYLRWPFNPTQEVQHV